MNKNFQIVLGEFSALLRETKNSPQWTSGGYCIRILVSGNGLIKLLAPREWRITLNIIPLRINRISIKTREER